MIEWCPECKSKEDAPMLVQLMEFGMYKAEFIRREPCFFKKMCERSWKEDNKYSYQLLWKAGISLKPITCVSWGGDYRR